MRPLAIIALALILARVFAEIWLNRLNQHHVRAHANEVPRAFRGIIDDGTYRRSVDYTLAKSRFGNIVNLFDAALLILVLFSGVLPWSFGRFSASFGTSIWAMAVSAMRVIKSVPPCKSRVCPGGSPLETCSMMARWTLRSKISMALP